MSESHTPGPWEIERNASGDRTMAIGPCAWWAVYADDGGLDVSEADARLIAAAPDLLELAHRVRELVKYGTLREQVDAAIAKATGSDVIA